MSEKLYKTIIDTLPYVVLVLDQGFRVTLCNRSCEELLSKSAEEIVGRELHDIIPHKELLAQAGKVRQSGGTKLVELYLNPGEGFPKVIRATVSALDEKSQHFLLILEDVSERVRLEEQLMQSEKLAGIGLLARSVAHELGNPLSIMSATLQHVRDTLLNAGNQPLTDAIEIILDSANQMHEILRGLSEFPGAGRPHFEWMDLRYVLSQVLNFICREAERRNIEIHQEFEDDLPRCQIKTGEVKQLFLNLCKNAIEAMLNGGKLYVKMGVTSLGEGEGGVRTEISDTGVGISETEMRFIFRPLYSTKPGGTGLGLSFCRRVVEEHGGEIAVKSRPGGGTSFIVALPVRQGEIEP